MLPDESSLGRAAEEEERGVRAVVGAAAGVVSDAAAEFAEGQKHGVSERAKKVRKLTAGNHLRYSWSFHRTH
jgi:hypothetical protein